jgi:hypothetical protein
MLQRTSEQTPRALNPAFARAKFVEPDQHGRRIRCLRCGSARDARRQVTIGLRALSATKFDHQAFYKVRPRGPVLSNKLNLRCPRPHCSHSPNAELAVTFSIAGYSPPPTKRRSSCVQLNQRLLTGFDQMRHRRATIFSAFNQLISHVPARFGRIRIQFLTCLFQRGSHKSQHIRVKFEHW